MKADEKQKILKQLKAVGVTNGKEILNMLLDMSVKFGSKQANNVVNGWFPYEEDLEKTNIEYGEVINTTNYDYLIDFLIRPFKFHGAELIELRFYLGGDPRGCGAYSSAIILPMSFERFEEMFMYCEYDEYSNRAIYKVGKYKFTLPLICEYGCALDCIGDIEGVEHGKAKSIYDKNYNLKQDFIETFTKEYGRE